MAVKIIVNDNNPSLTLKRDIIKWTSQSMHTSLQVRGKHEILKFSDGWRQATNTELYKMGLDPADYIN